MDAEKLKKGRDLYLEILECREKHDIAKWFLENPKRMEGKQTPAVLMGMPEELTALVMPVVEEYYSRKIKELEEEFEKL